MQLIIIIIPFLFFGCRNCNCPKSSNPSSDGTAVDGLLRINRKQESLKKSFYDLVRTMERGTYPPMWIAKKDLSKYMDKAKVLYDGSLETAIILATQKEPCRLNGQRMYDEEKFRDIFGYSRAPRILSDESIAIFTKTPVRIGPGEFVDINVMSVTWPNLEDESLPDLERLRNLSSKTERSKRVEGWFQRIFSKIAAVKNRERMDKIVFLDTGLDGSIRIAAEQFGLDMVDILNKVCVDYIGVQNLFSLGSTHISLTEPLWGNVVENIRKLSGDEAFDRTMFVNSASPVALLGNGNEISESADGKLGRITAISVLGWPVLNTWVQYEFVPQRKRGADLDID